MTHKPDGPAERQRLLRILMLAVFAWGSTIALGAYLFGLDPSNGEIRFSPNLWRGIVVESCVLGFLVVWWRLAAGRR